MNIFYIKYGLVNNKILIIIINVNKPFYIIWLFCLYYND